MKVLMVILLGLPGSPDPGVPQTVEIEAPELCKAQDPVYDIVDYDLQHRTRPSHTLTCVRGLAADIDQHGNITPPAGAKAAFIAVFDKSREDQKAGTLIFFSDSVEACEKTRSNYQSGIAKVLGLPKDAPPYPRTACLNLQQDKLHQLTNGDPPTPAYRLVFGTDFQNPATAQYWTLPIKDSKTCHDAKLEMGYAFSASLHGAPVNDSVIRSPVGNACVTVSSISQTLSAGPSPEDHARLNAIVADDTKPTPGKRATLEFTVRNMSMCKDAGTILQSAWTDALTDLKDEQWRASALRVSCVPIRKHDWDK